jgi:hypothetical protein
MNMNFADFATLTATETYTDGSPPLSISTTKPLSPASTPSTTSSSSSSSPSSTQPPKSERSSTGTASRSKRPLPPADRDEDDEVALKRHRNTLAARKYRQKRLDRIKELEDALADVTRERDDLRIRLARQEAETEALKMLMKLRADK